MGFFSFTKEIAMDLGTANTIILADGKIEQIEVSESSRYSSLDNSAMDAVAKMEKFQPIPKILEKERWRIEIPIQYKLNAGRS